MLRMAIGLVLVVLAILSCAWLAKRAGMGLSPARRLLREVDALRLGPRQRIALIELDQTWLVVGISAGQMTVLHSQPANAQALRPDLASAGAASVGTAASNAAPTDAFASTRAGFAALLAKARAGQTSK